MESDFEAVIGLEVHAQLSTDSKIFATSSTVAGKRPNTLTDPVTLGLPGCLPVLNKRVVDFAIRLGLATNCEIQKESIFSRKHYFYPDLPKGYQISQYDKPICLKGHLDVRIKGEINRIGITRIHLEEDAGKNIHHENEPFSDVDLNRAGVPLVEIVSEPDIRTPEQAGAYMRQLRQIVRYLDICDGNMEEGSLRCDANVSVRKRGAEKFGTKVEIKNINSFRYVEKAIAYEISRQIAMVEQGETIVQETRLWDENKNLTRSMRGKEHAEDYRYFPDPDLLPLIVDSDWIEKIRGGLPELPQQVFARFKKMYQLDDYYCELLTEEKHVARYYDHAVTIHHNPASIANWITTELFGRLNKEGVSMENCPVSPENLATLVKLIDDGVISGKIAKTVFDEMFSTGASPKSIIETRGLTQVSDPAQIESTVDRVIANNPKQVEAFRGGKAQLFGFFVGQVMKETEGKANPKMVNELLEKKLKG
ncbi:MAG: Asp-tRNA(Asn)/Glu-tRNA(Gln) amidotransferase subunit GatB [Bdellovibrionota bacterium]